MQKLIPCLWFDNQAEEAAKFYTSLFKHSRIGTVARYGPSAAEVSGQPEGAVMTVEFEIERFKFTALNGGPLFKLTPAMSFSAFCADENEVKKIWSGLSTGGKIMMEMDKYPWAEYYGWCNDKFGVSWQVMLYKEAKQKITPSLMFTQDIVGRAEEAINYYTSVFRNSSVEGIHKDSKTNHVQHAQFFLEGEQIILMEDAGPHQFKFTEGNSIEIHCQDQQEIDYFWSELGKGGKAQSCGWLKDKYGVSWQVVPAVMTKWMADADQTRMERVMKVMLTMGKLDLAKLEQAYRS